MSDLVSSLWAYVVWTFSDFNLVSVIDILLVALIFYGILQLTRGTQAVQLLRGIVFLLLIVVLVANLFQLTAFNWLIGRSFEALLISIPVIFQPELRRALERLGRAGRLINRPFASVTATQVINEIGRATVRLSERRHGALLVLERETGLQEIIETGVEINADLSADLILTIFFPNTALHDGAVVIREDCIMAAACVLPLSENPSLDRQLGTRHLAAVGVTEGTDAISIVVSEETGDISVAHNGRIIRNLDEGRLNRILHNFYGGEFATDTSRVPGWLRRVA